MDNLMLSNLLTEYEQKRFKNSQDLEKRKSKLYSQNPRLKEIEENLNNISISTIKTILSDNKSSYVNELKEKISKLKNEREQILKAMKKTPEDLNPIYDCKLCKDTGYVLKNNVSKMCSCLKQKLFDLEYNKNNIKKEVFDNFNLNLYSEKVNEAEYNSKISPRENILNIKNDVQKFIDNFDSIEEKNLLFSGGTGLGKTFLSNCIVNELLSKGKTVLYQTAPIMLDNLINELFDRNISSNISENLLSVDLLVIDDLGTETMNSMKFTELYKIINTRLLNQNGKITKTIISTNLDLQGLLKNYDERLISRFVGYYNRYKFYGDDIRLKK